jgi:hypothetical protein
MMKWFRNILLTLAMVFALNVNAQNSKVITPNNYNNWLISNQTCAGCGSFFIMVVNSPMQSDGYYYYDVYLWSNSFYSNGFAASSYVKNIKVSIMQPNGVYQKVLDVEYALVPPKSPSFNGYFHVAYVYSFSAQQIIKLNWSSTTPW